MPLAGQLGSCGTWPRGPELSDLGEAKACAIISQTQVALASGLAQPVVTAPIIGVTKEVHLHDALAAISLRLTADRTVQLEEPYTPTPSRISEGRSSQPEHLNRDNVSAAMVLQAPSLPPESTHAALR